MKHGKWLNGRAPTIGNWLGPDSQRAWVVCLKADFWGHLRFPESFPKSVFITSDEYPLYVATKLCPDFDKLVVLSDEELEAVRAMCANDTKNWAFFTAALIEHEIRDKLVTHRRQSGTGEM